MGANHSIAYLKLCLLRQHFYKKRMNDRLFVLIYKLALTIAFVFGSTPTDAAMQTFTTAAFYYANNPPFVAMSRIDVVVLEPDHVTDPREAVRQSKSRRQNLFAYVSVGEVNITRPYYASMPKEVLRKENTAWNSWAVDQNSPVWREFFLSTIIEPLWREGWRGFFLDTLDAYQSFAETDEERRLQTTALVDTIRAIKSRHPEAKIILNRGFELLPAVSKLTYAVAVESLYRTFDAGKNQYAMVPETDRAWLMDQLNRVRFEYRLPVIVIDYVDPLMPEVCQEVRETAARIRREGYVPWVTDGAIGTLMQIRCQS